LNKNLKGTNPMGDSQFIYSPTIRGGEMEKMSATAIQLAKLLQQTDEYQELLRAVGMIRHDPDANRLILQIRQLEDAYSTEQGEDSIEELQAQLLALPVYQAYIHAENSARALFQSVNQLISDEVGLNFALNARRKTCSCGG
jgi:cell fate (sporulation/competence/biofilm development) regulator YlbF (YheA/YmcA/DUF963 family)